MNSTELSAQELFRKYDQDGSGKISLEEFRPLLEELGLNLTVPKVLEYFQLCDSDGSGEIDYDEFKVALYVCNSEDLNPNGFNPGSILRPKDAFDMFDKDKSGQLDETEFALLLEYLNIDTDEATFEKMFYKYDTDHSGYIEYPEFKKVWLRLANPRKELEDRGIEIPTLFTRAQMIRLLEDVLEEEERKEALAVELAKKWKKQQETLRMRKKFTDRALRRSHIELCRALDAGGQVYVFGDGTLDQFRTVEHRSFDGIEPLLVDLWYQRIGRRRKDHSHGGKDMPLPFNGNVQQENISTFKNLNVQSNSVALWGRNVTGIAISDSAMIALYDDKIVSWGGRGQWWHELESDSHWQEVERGMLTARSNVIQGRQYPQEAFNDAELSPLEHNVARRYTIGYGEKFEKTKSVLQYYEVWDYNENVDIDNPLEYSKKCLQKRLKPERLVESLKMRGRPCSGKTKNEMVELLHDCIRLELKVLGEAKHLVLRDLEKEILSLRTKRKMKLAKRRLTYFMESWMPVSAELQRKNDMSDKESSRSEPEKLPNPLPNNGPNISSNRGEGLLNEIKPSPGPCRRKLKSIAAGANHAGVLSKDGHLYMWGVNTAGKLGVPSNGFHEMGPSLNKDNGDVHKPVAIPSLQNSSITTFSCGHSHTAAIDKGDLLVWGSTSSGKLGLGELSYDSSTSKEYYCPTPLRVTFPTKSSVIQVSCGSNHTAACVGKGHLFVWGNGSGYRLGLGDTFDRSTPTLIKDMQDISSVSCGNCQTLAISQIRTKKSVVNQSQVRTVSGGNLYVAGQASILGSTFKFFGEYDHFQSDGVEVPPRRINRISAGFSHQAAISMDGELFCWGDNTKGSCCHDENVNFIPIPSQVTCLYKKPDDLAIGKPTHSSPPYGDQPFYDIDLEVMSTIHEVKLWNTLTDPNNPANSKNEFTSRLFPCWIMISQKPFPLSTGTGDLQSAMKISISKKRFVVNQHVSCWRPPRGTMGQYIRIQLEGLNLMEFEKIEVFGAMGVDNSRGKVVTACCGKRVTATIVKAEGYNSDDRKVAFERSITANPDSERILRSLNIYQDMPTYQGRKNVDQIGCMLCAGGNLCEICQMKNDFRDIVKKTKGSSPSLEAIVRTLLDVENVD